MFSTTLFTGLSAALVFSNAAVAVAIHHPTVNVCKTGPYAAFAPLAKSPAAQEFCSSAYGRGKNVTITSTVTAYPTAVETVTITATSSAASTHAPVKKEKNKGSKCGKVVVSEHATATARPSSAASYKAVKEADRLYSSLVSAPPAVAKAVCSCIETPATVTVTATALPSGAVTASSHDPVTVTITTTYAVSTASTSTSASVDSSSSSASTSTSSASSAASTYASSGPQYESANGLVFAITNDSLYAADASNTIATSVQPDLQSCIMECAITSGCKYLLWVASTDYEMALQCYLLSNYDAGFGTGYPGIDTAEVVAV